MRYMLIALLLVGCAGKSVREKLQSWRGKPVSRVVTVYGLPSQESQIEGRKVYQYDLVGDTEAYRSTANTVDYSTERCRLVFFFDAEGYVESVTAQGNAC